MISNGKKVRSITLQDNAQEWSSLSITQELFPHGMHASQSCSQPCYSLSLWGTLHLHSHRRLSPAWWALSHVHLFLHPLCAVHPSCCHHFHRLWGSVHALRQLCRTIMRCHSWRNFSAYQLRFQWGWKCWRWWWRCCHICSRSVAATNWEGLEGGGEVGLAGVTFLSVQVNFDLARPYGEWCSLQDAGDLHAEAVAKVPHVLLQLQSLRHHTFLRHEWVNCLLSL